MEMIRRLIAFLCLGGALTACGSNDVDYGLGAAAQALINSFNRQEPVQMTVTRAGLETINFDQPLLVATIREPTILKSGLLLTTEKQGVAFWQSADQGTITLTSGVLQGTVSIGYDLYSAETAATIVALQTGKGQPYLRTYRHLNDLNTLDVTRYVCTMNQPVPETIVVFDRQHRTQKFVENCVPERPEAPNRPVEIQNLFWKDANRQIVWKSDQWVSQQVGSILLERVIE